MKREIIEIDEEKCNGCGLCVPNCYEGALQIIDGKARLISDLFCDGLGNCIGYCPQGAITMITREAEKYNEKKVMEKISSQGENTIKAHLEHLRDHNETALLQEAIDYLEENRMNNPLKITQEPKQVFHACPGTMIREIKEDSFEKEITGNTKQRSELTQWPVQLSLIPPNAPYFKDADLLILADCVAVADPNLHQEIIKGKKLAIGCPKLDNLDSYKNKIKAIIEMNDLNTITVAIMEVPCCRGLYSIVEEALNESAKRITLKKIVANINGSRQ